MYKEREKLGRKKPPSYIIIFMESNDLNYHSTLKPHQMAPHCTCSAGPQSFKPKKDKSIPVWPGGDEGKDSRGRLGGLVYHKVNSQDNDATSFCWQPACPLCYGNVCQ